jgi:hypothetical protein
MTVYRCEITGANVGVNTRKQETPARGIGQGLNAHWRKERAAGANVEDEPPGVKGQPSTSI